MAKEIVMQRSHNASGLKERRPIKKLVTLFMSIMLLPLSLWAMSPISDSDLSNVNGQAGVNINADLTMNISIGTMAWGDSDGLPAGNGNYMPSSWVADTTGGYIGVTGFNISNLWIRARTDTSDVYNSYSTLFLKPITIDVATDSTTGHGYSQHHVCTLRPWCTPDQHGRFAV